MSAALKLLVLVLTAFALTLSGCTCGNNCVQGQDGCACKSGNQCDDGAVCGPSNLCVTPGLATVVVSDGAARGCEVLVSAEPGTTVAAGRFDSTVSGTAIVQSPKVALAFVSANNAPITGTGVRLALSAGNASGLTVEKAACVDAQGARLPNATVTLR